MCAGNEFSPVMGVAAALLGFSLVTLFRKRWLIGGIAFALSLLTFLFPFTLAC